MPLDEEMLVEVWRLFQQFSKTRTDTYARLLLFDDGSGKVLYDTDFHDDLHLDFSNLFNAIEVLNKALKAN